MRLAIISDVHVLGPGEHEQIVESARNLGNGLHPVRRGWRRGLNRVRDRFWHWDPHSRRACFHHALEKVAAYQPDYVVANGDYGGDHYGVGLSDDHTFESVEFVLSEIRDMFPGRFLFIFGDHEIGKYSTVHRQGGIRLRSLERGEDQLGIRSFWHLEHGRYHLLGVNSSLLTLDLFLPEALSEELPEWKRRRADHMQRIAEAFASLPAEARVVLFCHDPGALSTLARIPEVRERLDRIAQTVVGHVHSPGVLSMQRWLRHLPAFKTRYPIARIVSEAAQGANDWGHFKPKVCPSTYGIGNHVSGGLLFVEGNGHGDVTAHQKRVVL